MVSGRILKGGTVIRECNTEKKKIDISQGQNFKQKFKRV